MANQKTALILGATGSLGGEITKNLIDRGWKIRALHRSKNEIENSIQWVLGDAMVVSDVVNAAKDVDIIFHGVNPFGYQNWETLPEIMLKNTIVAAKQNGAIIAFPANVYNYGRDAGLNPNEDSPQNPDSKKGKIRVTLEKMLFDASKNGVQIIALRMGDFFGPKCNSSWLTEGMIKKGQFVKSISSPSKNPKTKHEWAYLPDASNCFCDLIESANELPNFASFNFSSHFCNIEEISAAIAKAQKISQVKINNIPWWLFKIMSPFVPIMREILEMRYLWDEPMKLNDDKLKAFLGKTYHTPLNEAIKATLIGHKNIK